MKEIRVTDDLDLLLEVMPPAIQEALSERDDDLLEIVLDLGRIPEARYAERVDDLSSQPVERKDLDHVVERVGRFGDDNRAGIERTLHRISALRNRDGRVVGLTCRVGRAVFGTVDAVRDVIEEGRSVLLLGRPGVGKTTLLREAARVLADELGKRVVVVDTSNEIAGDGDVPHPGIGRARRMQVPSVKAQHAVMIEAVENHMPEVVVIDEIGTEAEALAARTIAERGVQLIATAHGNTLENLLQNPTLSDLIGGIQAVTLSDEEARRRRTQKTVLERKAPPTFDVVVEIQAKDQFAVHHQVAEEIDSFLRGFELTPEIRRRQEDGQVEIRSPETADRPRETQEATGTGVRRRPRRSTANVERERPPEPRFRDLSHLRRTKRIYPYAIHRSRLQQAIRKLGVRARLVDDLSEADLVITTKAHKRRGIRRLADAKQRGIPVLPLRSNTIAQMEKLLAAELGGEAPPAEAEESTQAALSEVDNALDEVLNSGRPVELSPRTAYLRRLQHEMVENHGLTTQSRGKEPYRRVVVYPA